jgi:hypothetical protein
LIVRFEKLTPDRLNSGLSTLVRLEKLELETERFFIPLTELRTTESTV